MKKISALFLSISVFFSINGLSSAADDSAGSLLTGKAVYDEMRYALLYPASLFDLDNSPSVFRLGLVWDERNGDEMRFIVNVPISEQVRMDDLKKSADTFKVVIDGREVKLTRVKNSILRKELGGFSKTYEAEIRYTGSKKLVDQMLAAKNVEFSITVLMKKFLATLKIGGKNQSLHKKDYVAINGMKRFRHAAWGDAK